MNRRELVRLLGLGVAGALAGCGSGGDDEQPPTPGGGIGSGSGSGGGSADNPVFPFKAGSTSEFEFEESDSGTVVIRVPVENTKDRAYAGKLTLTVDVGDDRRTLTKTIQLAGNEQTKVDVQLDADWDTWSPNFGGVRFSRGTPVDG